MERTGTKKLLFETALKLFHEKGCENVSVQDICSAAGTTRNAFYYHYGSMDDLLCSYYELRPISENELYQNLLLLPDPWERLLYIYEIHTRMVVQEGKNFVRYLSIACIRNRKSLYTHLKDASYCVPLIQQCKDEGLIASPLSAEDLSYLARTISNASARAWSMSEEDYDVIARTRQLVTQILRPELI